MSECIFCRIVNGEAAASIVAETAGALAFMDINQPVPGHVLVIPRRTSGYLRPRGDRRKSLR